MSKFDEMNKSIEIIDYIQQELQQYKVIKTIVNDQMSMVDVMKAIKCAQSKKCLAKAMSRTEIYNDCIVEENRLLALKDTMVKIPKVNKIQVKIDELLLMKQSKEIKSTIEILRTLL